MALKLINELGTAGYNSRRNTATTEMFASQARSRETALATLNERVAQDPQLVARTLGMLASGKPIAPKSPHLKIAEAIENVLEKTNGGSQLAFGPVAFDTNSATPDARVATSDRYSLWDVPAVQKARKATRQADTPEAYQAAKRALAIQNLRSMVAVNMWELGLPVAANLLPPTMLAAGAQSQSEQPAATSVQLPIAA